jgi:hypothetical protein
MKAQLLSALLVLLPVTLFAQRPADESSSAVPTPQQMQMSMQEMHEQMVRIHETDDPVERQRLLQEHMQSMHMGMMMMGRMMRDGSRQECAQGDAQCRMDQMQAHQEMMGERMSMMQMMMEQMTEHMVQHPSGAAASDQAPAGGEQEDHEAHH